MGLGVGAGHRLGLGCLGPSSLDEEGVGERVDLVDQGGQPAVRDRGPFEGADRMRAGVRT
jgi:hypothetical protein